MKLPEVPSVKFFGVMEWENRGPVEGYVRLIPWCPAIKIKGVLIATQSYSAELDEGAFAFDVIPTNVGVSQPWAYTFITPVTTWEISLPMQSTPISLADLLKAGSQ